MELAQHIKESARKLLEEFKKGKVTLPAEIEDSPGFFLASEEDDSVQAFSGIVDQDKSYKIGPKK